MEVRFSARWPFSRNGYITEEAQAGDVLDLPEDLAAQAVDAGVAEPVAKPKPKAARATKGRKKS